MTDILAMPHVACLLAAIDDGEDDLLGVLADALEEAAQGMQPCPYPHRCSGLSHKSGCNCGSGSGADSCPLCHGKGIVENAGDPRAAGLRSMKHRRPASVRVREGVVCFGWQRGYGHAHSIGKDAPALDSHDDVFHWGDWRLCDYRSDAYLALAAALA